MRKARILVTGASGCVGQYTSNWLLKNTEANLLLWIREPKKLTALNLNDPRIKLLIGDLREPEIFAEDLAQATHVIHTATAWGDIERTKQVNIIAVKKLLSHLNPDYLEKFIYFSTASILDKNLNKLPQAEFLGTEYIQTKAKCLQELEKHFLAPKIVAVFPTLVFGGRYNQSGLFPASYLTQGLQEASKWLWLARFFKGYSRFHFIHAQDIAFICGKLISNQYPVFRKQSDGKIPKLVLGQDYISIDQVINALLQWNGIRRVPQIPLWGWLIDVLVKILPIKISNWDMISIKQRHFTHEPVTSPEDFGGKSYAKSLNEILNTSGLPKVKKLT